MQRRNKKYIKMLEGTRNELLLKESNVNHETITPEQDKVNNVDELCSDCEIIDAISVASSADEEVSEVKDKTSNINNNCEPTVLNSVDDADASKPVLKEVTETDDVIFVEEKPAEIIVINCDDSQSVTLSGNESNNSVPLENGNKRISNLAAINSNQPNALASSVNDFLKASFGGSNDIPCSNRHVLCENESNSSTSDKENSFAFVQHEFAEHSQDNMLDLNLDSFTDYIDSVTKALKERASEILNEYHSSEYEDNKVAVTESKMKVEQTTKAKNETSDDCLVIKGTKNKSYVLPDLPPFSLDVESDGKNKSSISESNPLKKKMSQSSNKRVEKRRSDDLRELIKAKKSRDKQNESIQTPRLLNVDNDHVELINVRDDAKETPTQESTEGPFGMLVRFKDYWNGDAKKFDSDSCSRESLDLEAAQKNMSDSPEKWKIPSVDHSDTRLRPKGPLCSRCNDYEEKKLKCRKPLKPIKCSTCGERGHNFQRCPKSLCTSCGTGNYSVISCCSRCANRRSIRCRLCFQYGHFNTNCPDLRRRYHLTTQPGPSKQPTNHNFKPIEDRWCSICASRDHFNFECQNESSGNKFYSNVRPLVITEIENRRSSHSNTNTLFQSIPSSASLSYRQGKNVHEKNTETRFTPLESDHDLVNNPLPTTSMPFLNSPFQSIPSPASISYRQGKNVHEKNTKMRFTPLESDHDLVNNPLPTTSMPFPNFSQPQPTIASINLNKEKMSCLNNIQGKRFLDELREAFNVKIDLTKPHAQGVKFKCTMEGSNDAHLKTVKQKILHYISKHERFVLKNAFQCKSFNFRRLEVYLASLDNPYVNWLSQADSLYSKMVTTQTHILAEKRADKKAKLEKRLKRCLRSLNAVLIGKLLAGDGNRHMANLRQAKRNLKLNSTQLKSLLFSFGYVFNNVNYLFVPYRALIKRLPIGKDTAAANEQVKGYWH